MTTNSINCYDATFQVPRTVSRCHVIATQMSTSVVTYGSKTKLSPRTTNKQESQTHAST